MDFNPDKFDDDESEWMPGRDGYVCLVDCSKQMYDGKKFHEVIEMIKITIRNLIIKSEKNMFGVLFYNTEKSPPSNSTASDIVVENNIAVFLNIKAVCADSLKYVHNYLQRGINDFPSVYGHCDTNPNCLNDAVWIASKMLRNCGYKLVESRILVFTDNPKPFEPGSNEERNAFKKAEDLRDSGITVTVMPMSDDFTGEPFYAQFIETVFGCELPDIRMDLEKPVQTREMLMQRVTQKDYTKRCSSRIKFHFGQGLDMSVGIYSMYRQVKPPKAVTLHRKDNEQIQAKRVHVVKEASENEISSNNEEIQAKNEPKASNNNVFNFNFTKPAIIPTELIHYQQFGEDKIKFTNQERTKMQTLMQPGLNLLGFKPLDTFVLDAHLRGPNFMYPDEKLLKGSTTLFRALWERCLAKKVVAYGILVERSRANPKLVVLVPQDELSGKYSRYGGFRIEYVAYADAIRDIDAFKCFQDEDFPEEVINQGTELFIKVIDKLKFRYKPEKIANPKVTGLYEVIEATVLEEQPPPAIDTTLPDTEQMDAQLADVVEQFQELFQVDEAPEKKKRSADPSSQRPKMAKTFDAAEIERSNNLSSFTVDALKAYLTSKGVTGLSKCKKSDLVEKVQEIIETYSVDIP
ncbi:ATP-dependent DNA helicase 2 subunit 1 [Culicoides brevitarsis]|uniref:ATP-dependent DNA helicase 2 subunit 1 n=1 Tax=Culicoides brevitarsis TaxID=469753 RepID=UPI00307BBED7